MAKFYTLQGVDSPPEYYSEHELGSLLSQAIQKTMGRKLLTVSATKLKINPAKLKPSPVKISVATPKISVPPEKLKLSPSEAIKVGQGLQKVGTVSSVVGKGLTVVGGAISTTVVGAPIGAMIGTVGAGMTVYGEGMVKAGAGLQQVGQATLDAKGLSLKNLTTKEGLGIVSKISKTSDSLGVTKNASSTIDSISNPINQENNILNAFQSNRPSEGIGLASNLLNQLGVKQETTNLVSEGVNLAIKTDQNFRGASAFFPPTTIQPKEEIPSKPIFKDPVNDPTHPFYIPPPVEPNKGKISPLPNNQKQQDKKSDLNIGLFLALGLGAYLLTQKKGKRK